MQAACINCFLHNISFICRFLYLILTLNSQVGVEKSHTDIFIYVNTNKWNEEVKIHLKFKMLTFLRQDNNIIVV